LRRLQEGLELQGGNTQRGMQCTPDGIRKERDQVADALNNLNALESTAE
jgi:hypothetical protein